MGSRIVFANCKHNLTDFTGVKKMKKNTLMGLLLLAIAGSFSSSAYAFDVWVSGKPTVIYTDPSDVVVVLNKAGPCGSAFYHIQRSKTNFKEFSTLAENAFIYGKSLSFDVTNCSGDRNILSHGAMF
jgi:hypothetical protein